jgi:hypothetical protein
MEEKYLLSRGASDTPTRMVCSGYHTFRRTGMYSSLAKLSTNCLTSKFSHTILLVGHKNPLKMWPTAAISLTRPQIRLLVWPTPRFLLTRPQNTPKMWPGQSCLANFIVSVIFADHKNGVYVRNSIH